MENLTLQERALLIGLVLLLVAGSLTRKWRHSREPEADGLPAASASVTPEFSP